MDGVLRSLLLAGVHEAEAQVVVAQALQRAGALAGHGGVHVVGHAMKLLRADDKVGVRGVAQEVRAARLRHAAEEAIHDLRPVAVARGHEAHLAERLLLGEIAHRASVDQHHIGDLRVGRHLVAAGQEIARATCSESRSFIWHP